MKKEKTLEKEFWKKKPLHKLNKREWEALCARCGRCCLNKYSAGGLTIFINTYCRHLSPSDGTCRIYNRRLQNAGCVKVDMQLIRTQPDLLPDDCAYKLLAQGQDLPAWHPLVSGNPETVHLAGKSVRSLPVCSEDCVFAHPEQCLFTTQKR